MRNSLPRTAAAAHNPRKNRESGSALVEVAAMLPILILFAFGCFDMGLLFYASSAVNNAVRTAVLDTSSTSSTLASTASACTDVIAALGSMPNKSSFSSSCNGSPLTVTAQSAAGLDGSSGSLVTVAYTTISVVPVPWLTWLNGQFKITRSAQMRCRKT